MPNYGAVKHKHKTQIAHNGKRSQNQKTYKDRLEEKHHM